MTQWFSSLLLAAFMFHVSVPVETEVVPTERRALAELTFEQRNDLITFQTLGKRKEVVGVDLSRDAPASKIRLLRAFPHLRRLNLAGQPLSAKQVDAVAQLATLHSLDLSNTELQPEGLSELQPLKHLEKLALTRNRELTDGDIAKLLAFPKLKVLLLNELYIQDAGIEVLQHLIRLEHLDLDFTKVTDRGLVSLVKLPLRRLYLRGNRGVTDAGVGSIVRIKSLEDLTLSMTLVSDRGLRDVATLPALTCLRLENTPVTDVGLPALAVMPRLRELSLAATKVTDRGMLALARYPALQIVSLHETAVGDDGLAALAANKTLATLDLTWTKVTDKGLAHLAGCKTLQQLDLFGTAVTDAGLPALARIPALRKVTLADTRVTQAAVDRFRKAHPRIQVSYE